MEVTFTNLSFGNLADLTVAKFNKIHEKLNFWSDETLLDYQRFPSGQHSCLQDPASRTFPQAEAVPTPPRPWSLPSSLQTSGWTGYTAFYDANNTSQFASRMPYASVAALDHGECPDAMNVQERPHCPRHRQAHQRWSLTQARRDEIGSERILHLLASCHDRDQALHHHK